MLQSQQWTSGTIICGFCWPIKYNFTTKPCLSLTFWCAATSLWMIGCPWYHILSFMPSLCYLQCKYYGMTAVLYILQFYRFNIQNLNKQSRLYQQGLTPMIKTCPGRGIWERLRDRPEYEVCEVAWLHSGNQWKFDWWGHGSDNATDLWWHDELFYYRLSMNWSFCSW